MSKTAEKTDPALWERVKEQVTASSKGGKPGQWSARKAQLAVQRYKAQGGGYKGKKPDDNHLQQWQDEDWGTRSGKKSGETGERYLPKKAREELTAAEYRRTSAKKRADTRKGKPFSKQPKDVATKTAKHRKTDPDDGSARTRAELYELAKERKLPGRSKMSKSELEAALR
jgi:hypothetical protein